MSGYRLVHTAEYRAVSDDAWQRYRDEWLAPIPGVHPVYPLYEVFDWKRDRDDWLAGIRKRLRLVTAEHGLPPDLDAR